VSNGQRWVLGSWIAMVGFVTIRQIRQEQGLPSPGAYLGTGVVYTLLYGLAGVAPGLAAVLAVGTATAALAAPYFSNQPDSGVLATLTSWLNAINGTQPAAGQGASTKPGG
jgi:hypothetical protein